MITKERILKEIAGLCHNDRAANEAADRIMSLLPKQKAEKPTLFKMNVIYPFDSQQFKNAWSHWKEYKKKEKGFRYKSELSEQASLKKLSEISGSNEDVAIKIIYQSIENGWSGFFEIKKQSNEQLTKEQASYLVDRDDI